MPMACLPTEIAGRNRMMRYMAIEAIRHEPSWNNGDYTAEPTVGIRSANEFLLVMGSSPLQMQKAAPTRAAAEAYVERYVSTTVPRTDANDFLYYLDASRNYDPSKKLATITAPVLWMNSADDFINPPELGIAEAMVQQIPHAKFILIPISDATRGHGTHPQAAVWKNDMIDFPKQTESK